MLGLVLRVFVFGLAEGRGGEGALLPTAARRKQLHLSKKVTTKAATVGLPSLSNLTPLSAVFH